MDAGELKGFKREVTHRLEREGRWHGPGGAAEVRDQLVEEARAEGLSKEEAHERAYRTLDSMYPPGTFRGYEGDVDAIIDPAYTADDAGCRLRDSYVWVGDEFRRITLDSPDGTTIQDFSKAKTPPPTPLAIAIAEYYGENRTRRGELFTKLAAFAAKQHRVEGEACDSWRRGGFLNEIE